MSFDGMSLLLALGAIVAPLLLAWVLLAQPSGLSHRRERLGEEERRQDLTPPPARSDLWAK